MIHNKLIGIALLLCTMIAWSLESDREQPLEITSDTAELDTLAGTAIYQGNVLVIQGTIEITGDYLEVYFNQPEKTLRLIVVRGDLAHYQQLSEKTGKYDTAEGKEIRYIVETSQYYITGSAHIEHGDVVLTGEEIEYNQATGKTKAKGEKDPSGEERVHVVIDVKDI